MNPSTEQQFHQEMISICDQAKGTTYNPSYFREMVLKQGGLATAQQLLKGK